MWVSVKDRLKKYQGVVNLPLGVSLCLMLAASLGITLVMFYLAPESLSAFLQGLKESPTLFLWNYLPVLLLMAFLFFASNNSVFSIAVTGLVGLAMAFINRQKVLLRQDPFLPTDISLAKEMVNIIQGFTPLYMTLMVLGILFLILSVFISLYFFQDKPLGGKIRLIGVGVSIAVFFGLNTAVYRNQELYDSYPIAGNAYFTVNQYVQKGFLYSFIKDANFSRVQKPDGYDANTYARLEADFIPTDHTSAQKPHIIMIMGEAYSDLSSYDVFDFTGYRDPMENYRAIEENENSVSGHIIVPNFGGGTSDTEFDVLTAFPTRYIDGTLASYSYVNHPIPALPAFLLDQGYRTLAIHPGYSWFYNRANVYPALGFQDFLNLEEDFDPETQNRGGYISDEAAVDMILETFEQNLRQGEDPLFSFTVTIQNHGPFDEKYLDQQTNFQTDVPISETDEKILSGYFRGICDMDAQLGRLVNYFSATDEPVVLVFFGDHLPGFPGALSLFEQLELPIGWGGDIEERLNVYKTPFFIWQNDSAKALSDITAKDLFPENGLISANYLGSALLELLGLNGLSAYLEFSNELLAELPVVTLQSFMAADGTFLEEAPEALLPEVRNMQGWVYYQLFDK